MISTLVYFAIIITIVSTVAYVSWCAGRAHERKLQRERRERRIAEGSQRRSAARPGSTPARVRTARIRTSRMRE